jgi:hypothetical protein
MGKKQNGMDKISIELLKKTLAMRPTQDTRLTITMKVVW